MTTSLSQRNPMELSQRRLAEKLLAQERARLTEAERMQAIVESSTERPYYGFRLDYRSIIQACKKHILALNAGLLPVKIVGKAFRLGDIIAAGVPVPTEIIDQAEEAKKRLPGASPVVYGLGEKDEKLTAEDIRRRDPVLAVQYGSKQWFLGFWLECDMADTQAPEFIGITHHFAERRGRGRPKKIR